MNTADLQFNIIFTPNTVEYLSPFVLSLLRWTDCRYRIISNGCAADERRMLEDFCRNDSRLEYLLVNESGMLEHGLVLDQLQELNTGDWFCFMDSDILAVGPYMEQLREQLAHCDVFSSGHPLWHADEDILLPVSFQRLQGSYFATEDGKSLGGTYFAIYYNPLLTQIRSSTGVGFRFYRWDEVAQEHRQTLRRIGLDKLDYDTGKLLMALMLAAGARFRSADINEIRHLGGFSARAGDEPAHYYRGRLDRIACRLLGGLLATPLLYLADTWYGIRWPSPGLTPEQDRQLTSRERRVMQSRDRKRRNTARYFKNVMRALRSGVPLPPVPKLGHRPAEMRLQTTAQQIAELYTREGLCPTNPSDPQLASRSFNGT